MNPNRRYLYLLVCLLLTTFSTPLQALLVTDASIGKITFLAGKSKLKHPRMGKRVATLGAELYMGDLITTLSSSRLVVLFNDETNLHIGPSSKIILTQYLFNKEGSKVEALLDLLRGQIRLWTNKKLLNEGIRLQTSNAVAGVRGTTLELVYWRWLNFSMVGVLDGKAFIKSRHHANEPEVLVNKDQCGWVVKKKITTAPIPLADAPKFFQLLGDGTQPPPAFVDPWPTEINDGRFKGDY